jgi:heme exporter protein C
MTRANPDPIERVAARASRPLGWALLALVAIFAGLVIQAPEDRMQGVIQKILYVHVPTVLGAYLGFIVTAVAGALYLWRDEERWDRLAASAAEVGVVFCTLVLLVGPIWAKGTWGRFWTWDLRLTLTLLLWFVYVAYLLLRSFTEGGPRAARFASVYGMAGLLVIPLNYFAIELAGGRSMHPENLEGGSFGEGMGLPFATGMAVALVAFLWLLALRVRVAGLRARAERDQVLEGERPGPAPSGAGPWPT